MDKKINWLHFSDLHYGQKGQRTLWPRIKKDLFKDLIHLKNAIGKIDIVLFSGDLTFSGSKEEFNELTAMMKELWDQFKTNGSDPYLVAIPGNHDLKRPEATKPAGRVLRNYQIDEEIKSSFWQLMSEKNDYSDLINECFKNFTNWYETVDLPKLPFKRGLIPGDISIEATINDVSLKIVGLNTAFLELSNDDYKGKLAISQEQIMALTSEFPLEWAENSDISILMTHHDPTWYDQESMNLYNNDINPGHTYYNHLCGHLHIPRSSRTGWIGSDQRKIQIAPSLFGLETIKGKTNRIHGYFAGSYEIVGDQLYENFYPRIAHKDYEDSYKISADNGFNLDNNIFIQVSQPLKFPIHQIFEKQSKILTDAEDGTLLTKNEPNVLDLNKTTVNDNRFNNIPKLTYVASPQHLPIRLFQQNSFKEILEKNRYCWLTTDWGLYESGFIGSVLAKMEPSGSVTGFMLNCEDIVNEDELLQAYESQFGMQLQSFCNIAAGLPNSLLVLNHVNGSLFVSNSFYSRFMQLVFSTLDFCPNMKIIIITRQVPSIVHLNLTVKLEPLDISEIRNYVKNHTAYSTELEQGDNMLTLKEVTSGLPKHIDRILENLRLTSFDDVIEAEKYENSETIDIDQIPKSLRQAIGALVDSTEKVKTRSLELLKILTVLYNGETIINLRRFFGTRPITPENGALLQHLSLIEIASTTKVLSNVKGDQQSQQIKILRVPRQIRDFVSTLISDEEKDEILKAGCDLYFGNKWRSGSIKDIYHSVFSSSKFLNVDNCHLITNGLMASAMKRNDDFEIERAAKLAINFCTFLYDKGDYRNTVSTSEEIYSWLKNTSFVELKTTNATLYGKALRMVSHTERSTEILNEALRTEGVNLSNSDKNGILTDLGYAYIKSGEKEKAVECAKEMEKTASPKSITSIQAKYIIADATLTGDQLLKRLKALEIEARKADSTILLNNIMLSISSLETDIESQEKRLSKIIDSKKNDYNIIRAVIRKSNSILNTGRNLSSDDLHLLSISYSYLYTQRLKNLFNECHRALWTFCVREKKIDELLNLYKHSSLVWRIIDDIEQEQKYFQELNENFALDLGHIGTSTINIQNRDYFNRRKLEFLFSA